MPDSWFSPFLLLLSIMSWRRSLTGSYNNNTLSHYRPCMVAVRISQIMSPNQSLLPEVMPGISCNINHPESLDTIWRGVKSQENPSKHRRKKHTLLDNQLEYTCRGGQGRPSKGLLIWMPDGPGVDHSTKATENDRTNDEGNCLWNESQVSEGLEISIVIKAMF